MCLPKVEGGQGIRDPTLWNIAVLTKLVWDIARKVDCLWIKWIDHVYLKGGDFWTYNPSANCSWYWRKLVKVRETMKLGFDPNTNAWLDGSGQYTAAKGYEWLRPKQGRVLWYHVVWHKYKIPKCSFITWLTLNERLLSKDRLLKLGQVVDQVCVLCNQANETIPHLFFACEFTKEICTSVLVEICQESGHSLSWGAWQPWLLNWKGSRKAKEKLKLAFTTVIYHCWRERNARIFSGIQANTGVIRLNSGRMILHKFRGL